MKTKSFSKNRVTRSHNVRSNDAAITSNRVTSQTGNNATVSKRDSGAILRQAKEIRESWTTAERDERAQLGAERRAELCALLFGAN